MSRFISVQTRSINIDHIIYVDENMYGNIAIHLTNGETIYVDELDYEALFGYDEVTQLVPCNGSVLDEDPDRDFKVYNARYLAVTRSGSVRSIGDTNRPLDLRTPDIFGNAN